MVFFFQRLTRSLPAEFKRHVIRWSGEEEKHVPTIRFHSDGKHMFPLFYACVKKVCCCYVKARLDEQADIRSLFLLVQIVFTVFDYIVEQPMRGDINQFVKRTIMVL